MIFHTRFPGQGEVHEVRVHEMFINEDGWPVVAPLRYAPLSKASPAVAAAVPAADTQGAYKMVNHGKDISAAIKVSSAIRLNADGTVSGAVTGKWTNKGDNNIAITLDGTAAVYNGVLSRQWNSNANAFVVTFTAQNGDGVSLWGVRTAN
jgi:arabinan endo-1,5-alpha-L-arabinosidase